MEDTIKSTVAAFCEYCEKLTLKRNGKATGTANSYKNVIVNVFKYLKIDLDAPFDKRTVLPQIEQMAVDSADKTAFYKKYNELVRLSPPSHSEKGFIIPAINRFVEFLNGKTKYYCITVYADKVVSNIKNFKFDWDYISKGGKKKSSTYINLEKAVFISNGQEIPRKYEKREEKKSGIVLARLAIQAFESKLDSLTEEERRSFKTDGTQNNIGFWNNLTELIQQWGNHANAGKKPSAEYVADKFLGNAYPSSSKTKYYFYNAGLYDSIIMAQSLLKKFGASGDHFKATVWQSNNESGEDIKDIVENTAPATVAYSFNDIAKNTIFYGVPGSGKSFIIKNAIRECAQKWQPTDRRGIR